MPLPTSYAQFFSEAFGSERGEHADVGYLFATADELDALDACTICQKPVINLTSFTQAVGEHYVLADPQFERFEAILEDSGVDISDDELCREHAE